MSNSQWQRVNERLYRLSGALDRNSVPQLWAQLKPWHLEQSEIEVSLESIVRVDSAGMVMLIHLIEHAKKQNCHIMLSFMPKQLKTLFQLSNVEDYLDRHLKN